MRAKTESHAELFLTFSPPAPGLTRPGEAERKTSSGNQTATTTMTAITAKLRTNETGRFVEPFLRPANIIIILSRKICVVVAVSVLVLFYSLFRSFNRDQSLFLRSSLAFSRHIAMSPATQSKATRYSIAWRRFATQQNISTETMTSAAKREFIDVKSSDASIGNAHVELFNEATPSRRSVQSRFVDTREQRGQRETKIHYRFAILFLIRIIGC